MIVPYELDSRFQDILQIPTKFKFYSFDNFFIRPFTVGELKLINASVGTKTLTHVLRAVDLVTSCDLDEITDGDFAYILAWLKLFSFPKAPTNASWTCVQTVVKNDKGQIMDVPFDEAEAKGYTVEPCANNNVYMSQGASVDLKFLKDDFELPEGCDFPRVSTLLEAEELQDDPKFKRIIKILRCVKSDKPLRERIKLLENDSELFERALAFSEEYTHGVIETIPIWCNECNHRQTVTRPINFLTYLSGYTEHSLMDMEYNLMAAFGYIPSDDYPSKKLLYQHSCFVKDRQEKRERKKVEEAQRKKNLNRRRMKTGR